MLILIATLQWSPDVHLDPVYQANPQMGDYMVKRRRRRSGRTHPMMLAPVSTIRRTWEHAGSTTPSVACFSGEQYTVHNAAAVTSPPSPKVMPHTSLTHPHPHTAGWIHCSGWVSVAALTKLTSTPTPARLIQKCYSKCSTSEPR